ncbi:CGNR zinc finger domain-containing protein [Kribbella sp. NPDC023855]|uniref:CGNR zinc finger domain-containing protein n=1 Tax=Kribbella sp. NPDC023855 TaxID=3154698 RepID=UPI00340C8D2B
MFIDRLEIPTVVAVVNGWGTVPRATGQREGFPESTEALLPGWAGADSQTLERTADAIFPVFANGDPAERVRTLSGVLERTGVRPTIGLADGGLAATWWVEDPSLAVLAAAGLTLRQQLADHDSARVGLCSADNCADVYIDISPRAHRRFCSVTCQNRNRIAAYRRRHAT